MYADDLLLLSISMSDLQKMLDICVEELDSLDMKIDVKKSNWLRIGGRHNSNIGKICVYNIALKNVEQVTYHGITILAGRAFRCDLHRAEVKLFKSLNGILGKVGTRHLFSRQFDPISNKYFLHSKSLIRVRSPTPV